jgi:SAM-dependent methyltransferase
MSLWEEHQQESGLFEIQKIFERNLEAKEEPKVLEAGCGSVSLLKFKANTKIVGIDISQQQLDRNPILSQKILGDIQTYNLSGMDFDAIICRDVFEHLDYPEKALENFERGLAPGGMVIIMAPNLFSLVGLVTKYTPLWFHIWVYRHIIGAKNAGTEGKGPFATPFRLSMAPGRVKEFAVQKNLKIERLKIYQDYMTWKLARESMLFKILFSASRQTFKILSFGRFDIMKTSYFIIMKKPHVNPNT